MKRAVTLGLISLFLAAVPVVASAQNNDWGLWNGAHVGLNFGGGIGTDVGGTQCAESGTLNGTGCPWPGQAAGASTGGILGGLQLGWDSNADRMIFGIEADYDYGNIQGTPSYSGTLRDGHTVEGGFSYHGMETLNWLATARLRVGYQFTPRSMFYVTAGWADGQEALSTSLVNPSHFVPSTACFCGSTSITTPGWVEGAGWEWGMGNRMTGRVEFLNYNLRGTTYLAHESIASPFTYGKDFNFVGDVVRVGVNWRLK